MNRYLSQFVFLLTSCVIGIANLQAEDTHVLGSQWTTNISEAYQQGQFSDFLNKMEARYAKGLQNNDWDDLRNEEKKLRDDLANSENKERFQESVKNSINYKNDLDALYKEQMRAQLSTAKEYPDYFVSKVINDLKINPPETSIELNETLADYTSTQFEEIHFKTKVFHTLLSMSAIPGQEDWTGLEKMSSEEIETCSYVIRLDAYQQMLKQAEDEAVKNKISDEMSRYSINAANNHNEKYLLTLAKGTRQPDNEAEKGVAGTLKNFQQKQKELIKKYNLGFPGDNK